MDTNRLFLPLARALLRVGDRSWSTTESTGLSVETLSEPSVRVAPATPGTGGGSSSGSSMLFLMIVLRNSDTV